MPESESATITPQRVGLLLPTGSDPAADAARVARNTACEAAWARRCKTVTAANRAYVAACGRADAVLAEAVDGG